MSKNNKDTNFDLQFNHDLLKISEIAKEAGVLPSTIRYYTDLGLVNVASYTKGGHRFYQEQETIKRIRQVQFLLKKGSSIMQIKEQFAKGTLKKKILVVDDDRQIGELINDMFKEKTDYEIKIAYDGFTAGKILNDFLPDLVILDLLLPGVNGFEICKQIRQDKLLDYTKILAITGYDSPEHRKQTFDSGANDYLTKPMDIKVLLSKINALLGT